jgi:uncharacterized membrane protein SpoIIM required for sporulation
MDNRSLGHWLQGRLQHWQRMEALLKRQRGRKDESSDEVLEFINGYRSLSRDVSLARHVLGGSRITTYLESLLVQAYDIIQRRHYPLRLQLLRLLRDEIPAVVRELAWPILFSLSIFVVTALIGWWLVDTYPELVSLVASEEMIRNVQQGSLWTDDLLNVMPSSLLSVSILTNNIMVTFFAFALGIFYGLGTLYIMGVNGLMLGGVFAFTHQYSMAHRLFEFIVAHGMVELSVIVLAGAAGMKLGEALIRPGQLTRVAAFQQAVSKAGKLIALGVPLLIGAGIIEGNISPNPAYDLTFRVTVGSIYWIVMVLLLTGWWWPRRKKL